MSMAGSNNSPQMMGGGLSDLFKQRRLEILVATWLAYFGFYFCRKAFYVVKSTMGVELGISATDLGDIGAVYLIAYTFGQFASAAFGTWLGPRVLLLVGIILSVICNIIFGLADSYATFVVFMAINGLAQAAGWPACIGTLSAWLRREERGTIMGVWATCYQVGGVAATAWAAMWLSEAGFRGAFFAASTVLLAIWFVVFFFQRNKPEDLDLEPLPEDDLDLEREVSADTEQVSSPSVEVLWPRVLVINILLIGLFYFGVKFIRYALWSWVPFIMENNYGLAGDEAGYVSLIFDFAGLFGTLAAGYYSDKLFKGKRTPVAFIMLVGMMLSCILLYSVAPFGVFYFALALAPVGFMLFGPDSLMTGAGAMDVGSKRVALAAAGIINGMGAMGSVVQEFVVGRMYDQNNGEISGILFLFIIASLTSLAAIIVLMVRAKRGVSTV